MNQLLLRIDGENDISKEGEKLKVKNKNYTGLNMRQVLQPLVTVKQLLKNYYTYAPQIETRKEINSLMQFSLQHPYMELPPRD